MPVVRCPMPECRRRIDLDAIPAAPAQLEVEPCFHYIAAWGGQHGRMVEAVMQALAHNREFAIRNLRPADIDAARIERFRADLEAAARRFAHEVLAEPASDGAGALFGDQFERDHVAFAFAQILLGPDPATPR